MKHRDMKQNKKESNFFQTFIYGMKLSYEASKFYTWFRLLYSTFSAVFAIGITYMGKLIIDALSEGMEQDRQYEIFLYLLILTILTVFLEVSHKVNEYIGAMHNDILKNKVRASLIETAVNADMEFFDSVKFYDAFESVKQDTYSVVLCVWSMMDFIAQFISLCSAMAVLGYKNLGAGLIIILATIPTAVVSRKYTEKIYFWSLDNKDAERKMSYLEYVASDKAYASEIRLYQIGKFLENYYIRLWSRYFKQRRQLNRKRVVYNALATVLPWIVVFFLLLSVTHRILNGNGTVGDYSLMAGMFHTLSSSTLLFINSAIEIYENKLKMDNIKNFQKYESKIEDHGTCTLEDNIKIEFKNVSFRYPDTENYVLRQVSFRINEGEHVGLVGLNGSGKSTIIKLLLRFYDPDEGKILINDKDIKDYPIETLRQSFSTFFQQYVIFAFSMKDNISMFDKSVTEDKLLEAIDNSDSKAVYDKLGSNMEIYLTKGFEENGVELSGGQKQKIALARAFYRKGNAVILDEPSAALDPEAEYRIFQRMEELCRERTAVFVSHRLSNIVFADKVILMENGKVIEQGTHKELIALAGRYAELFQYQASQYENLTQK